MARPIQTRYPAPVPVVRPPQGTTYAQEAPGNASAFPVNTSFGGFNQQPQSGVIAGSPAAAATALQSVANAPVGTPALGTAYGSSRIIPNGVSASAPQATGGGGSFQGFSYTDPTTGRPAFGSATTTAPGVAASQGSGIFVNGQSVTHDANGNLAPVTGPADNPAARAKNDLDTLKETYSDVFKAGSDANKKFTAAAKAAGLTNGSDPSDLLALAKSTLPEPAIAGPGNAQGEQAANDAKNAPSAGASAANAVIGTATGAANATGAAAGSAYNNATDFVAPFTGNTGQDVRSAGSNILQAGENILSAGPRALNSAASAAYNFFGGGSDAPATTTPPVAPPSGGVASPTPAPSVAGTAAGGALAAVPLAPNALNTPVAAPVIDPDELKRRQAALQASNS